MNDHGHISKFEFVFTLDSSARSTPSKFYDLTAFLTDIDFLLILNIRLSVGRNQLVHKCTPTFFLLIVVNYFFFI